jgi:glycosyltransferase involved in cell wall biosynthesis
MIVRNEERNLAECLQPVAELFDEIIVVDTGSSDATREIAARFTPHVHEFAWCDDFAAARNESLRHATGHWVMWLDADDRLRPADVARLAALLETLDEQPRIYMMDTVSSSHHECEGEWRVTHRRLFRRLPGLAWRGRVHEQLSAGPESPAYEAVNSEIEIEHVGYRDQTDSRRKLQRNIRLLQMDYAVDPDDASTLFHLGITLSRIGTTGEARKHLLRLVERQCLELDLMRRVFAALAELSFTEAKPEEAEDMVRRGLVFFPNDEYLLYLLAQCLYELHRYDEARAILGQVMSGSMARRPYGGGPGHIRRKLAPRKLAAVLRMQDDFAAAEATLAAVLQEYPDETHAWYLLGLVYIDTGAGAKLANVIQQLGGCSQGPMFALLLLAAWQLRTGQLAEAGPVIEQVVAKAPEWPLPRLLRSEWLAQCGAPRGDQERAFRDLLRVQPGNRYALLRLEHLAAPLAPAWTAPANPWGSSVIVSAGA